MKSNKLIRILITGAGGPSAISLFKALQPMIDLDIYMADMDPFSAGLYLVPPENRTIFPAGSSPEFCSIVEHFCKVKNIDAIIPTVDCELLPLSKTTARFKKIGVELLCSPSRALSVCTDKALLMDALSYKFDLPEYSILDSHFCAERFGYPFIAKPRQGSGSKGIYLIHSKTELLRVPIDGTYLVQRYFPGKEFSVDVYIDRSGSCLASVLRERIRVDSGIAVISRTVQDDKLCRTAEEIACYVGLRYAANIQFKNDSLGQPCLLEINPRFPGTAPLTIKAGANIPAMCIAELRGETPERVKSYKSIAMIRMWSETYLPTSELQDRTEE